VWPCLIRICLLFSSFCLIIIVYILLFQLFFVTLQSQTHKTFRIMTAIELNSELFFAMGKIASDEGLMKKLLKYAKKLAAQRDDETLVSKDEFMASLERGEEEYRQGRCVRLLPGESVSEMLRRSGL